MHFAIAIAVSFIHRVVYILSTDTTYYITSGYFRGFGAHSNQVQLGAGMISSFLQYSLILTGLAAITYYNKYMLNQQELDKARLNALQMQLQPHFLFNTLNSITSLIDIDSTKAQKMLTQLGLSGIVLPVLLPSNLSVVIHTGVYHLMVLPFSILLEASPAWQNCLQVPAHNDPRLVQGQLS